MNTEEEKKVEVTAEELAAEEAGLVLPKEEDVRAEVIEDTGFDPEDPDQKTKIDKLVEKRIDGAKKLSQTIGAKRGLREKLDKKAPAAVITAKKDEDKDLSTTDLYALMEGKVPQEDVEEVKKASKLLGKSIPETLKDETFQAVLKDRQEKRASSAAMNTRGGQGGAKKSTDAEILERSKNGEVFEKGSPEAEQLFWAKRGGRRS